MDTMLGILWLVCGIFVWIAYHKLFDVVYLNLGQGLLKEFIISAILGGVLAALILYFWYITVPVLAIALFVIIKRKMR